MQHAKLEEILLPDFLQVESIKTQLKNYDACFYCMGISVLGLNEEQYTKITYATAKVFVDVLYELNPAITFIYVSGTGTDSSEKGKTMWARIKGKTENMIFNKGFKNAYAFRPGAILPEKGIQSKTFWYNAIYIMMTPFFPIFKKSKNVTTTTRVGLAMVNALASPPQKRILENIDINELAGA